jgi:XTP/dITP diphosphohydrolase
MKIHAATSNFGKLAEFATSAGSAGIEVVALPGLASIPEPVEDALTFMGNAELKARAYSLAAPGLLVFADDSGLEVDALHGAPGVRSARYADDAGYGLHSGAARDARNNAYLLQQLADAPATAGRRARFVCTLALGRDGDVLLRAEGFVEGEILRSARGEAGFGYDPLFLLPELGLSMAELSSERKWQISHRGNAFRSLIAQIGESALQLTAQPPDNRSSAPHGA